MERVEKDWQWSLFDPKKVPHLTDLYGDEFRAAYERGRSAGPVRAPGPARELYSRMMRTLAQTGNGWMTFKDASQREVQPDAGEAPSRDRVVHLSNLCTEILEVTTRTRPRSATSARSTWASSSTSDGQFDFERLGEVVRRSCRSSTA